MTKSAISCKFGHIKLKKSLMRNFIFYAAADIGANMRSGAESMTFRMNNWGVFRIMSLIYNGVFAKNSKGSFI